MKTPNKNASRLIIDLALFMVAGLAVAGQAQAQTATNSAEALLPPLRTSEMVVQVQIGDNPEFPWTVVPEISPDKLRVGCTPDATTRVSFASDLETREFEVSGTDYLQSLSSMRTARMR